MILKYKYSRSPAMRAKAKPCSFRAERRTLQASKKSPLDRLRLLRWSGLSSGPSECSYPNIQCLGPRSATNPSQLIRMTYLPRPPVSKYWTRRRTLPVTSGKVGLTLYIR